MRKYDWIPDLCALHVRNEGHYEYVELGGRQIMRHTLLDLAKVIRSKNAGPFEVTFDIMFDDLAKYERVKRAGVINAARIAELYQLRMDDVLVCRSYDPAVAFKITIRRPVGSGDVQDRDVYGCQQHVPLMAIEVPETQ